MPEQSEREESVIGDRETFTDTFREPPRCKEGADDSTAECEECIHHCAHLFDSREERGVEAGPHHPEEQGARQGEQVGAVARAIVLVALGLLAGEEDCYCQAIVAPEDVDDETTAFEAKGISAHESVLGERHTRIESLKFHQDKPVVQPVEEGLDKAQDDELRGRGLAQDSSVCYKHSSHAE